MNILVTLPYVVQWADYQKELALAEDWSHDLNFKVSAFPLKAAKGDRCYVVHRNQVMGWQVITGFEEKSFECSTTGRQFSGKFIKRSGPFHPITGVPFGGFQGYRYAHHTDTERRCCTGEDHGPV